MSTSAARELIDPDRVLNWSPAPDTRRAAAEATGAERTGQGLVAAAVGAAAAVALLVLAARPRAR